MYDNGLHGILLQKNLKDVWICQALYWVSKSFIKMN
jgi:hypothetical protein